MKFFTANDMKMSLKKTSIILCLMAVPFSGTFAQSKYTISGTIKDLQDTIIFLANYYGNKLYYNDTAEVDSKGRFSFPGKPFKECGKYSIVMPDNNRFDFVAAEENIVFEFTKDCSITNMKVKESVNNKVFFDYVKFISEKMTARKPLDTSLADSTLTEDQKKPLREQMTKLNEEVMDYQKELIKKNPELLVSKLLKMSMDIDVPSAPADSSAEGKRTWGYYYFRNHYFDNIDLTDPRMIRDQAYHRLIERYIKETLPQMADTMMKEADALIARLGSNEDGYKYIVHQFTYHFETGKIMCLDKGFVHMIDKYYSPEKCTWMKREKLDEMKKAADDKRHCLCDVIGQNIILPDSSDRWKSMYDLKSKYTLLVIWESSCGHCKKEVPKLNELYKRWKPKGLEVFAVHNNLEVDKWKKFIRDENLEFVNVCRNQFIMNQDSATKLIYGGVTTLPSLNFHQYWDVNSTPKVYLMDKDHKIIAKGIGHEQLEEILDRLESGNKDLGPMKETKFEDEKPQPQKSGKPQQSKNIKN